MRIRSLLIPTASPVGLLRKSQTRGMQCRCLNSQDVTSKLSNSCSVAVVGAGAAGLVAARELQREGHSVAVFDQNLSTGGVWVYTPDVEDDPLGQRQDRRRVHSSMYRQLRTNLPREVMGFTDFPFDPELMGKRSVDSRRYCSHEEVRNYLDLFADYYGLRSLVQLGTRLEAAQPLWPGAGSAGPSCSDQPATSATAPRWRLTLWQQQAEQQEPRVWQQEFDALVVCNGHYSEPFVAAVEGAERFPGLQLHSHNYRQPSDFAGMVVLVVGAGNSGEDIAAELAAVAREVVLSARAWSDADVDAELAAGRRPPNVRPARMVQRLGEDGSAEFEGGARVPHVDAVVYCTGYHYTFPFLEGTGLVDCSQQHVSPLWHHMLPPAAAPSLSFLGLPWKVVPFPLCELQAKLVARALSGRITLPPRGEMLAAAHAEAEALREAGVAPRYTHRMGDDQWAYDNWLATTCGPDVPPLSPWRERMYRVASKTRRSELRGYRDMWPDQAGAELAQEEFRMQRAELRVDA